MMAATGDGNGNGGAVGGDSERYRGGDGSRVGHPDEEVPAGEGSSCGSSQLISGPAGGGGSAAGMKGWTSHAPDDLSIDDCTSNDASYFILDEGGRHVLDDQGSPARARKWQPVNAQQRERYTRLHLATKGPRATNRWLPSVLVSPDHLRVPRARTAKDANSIKGVRLGGAGSSFVPGITPQQQFPPGSIITSGSFGNEEGGRLGEERRREIEVAKKRQRFLVEERRRSRPKQLDGFMLMDACGCDLPDEGRRADVSGRGLVSVVREDMSFFVRLQVVDAGDNSLPFDSFVDLPRLDELRLPCNSIRDIDVPASLGQQHYHHHQQQQLGGASNSGYIELRRLDLSYNVLSGDALSALTRLPSLTELDLTCNGLTDLPKAMGRFPRLQKLSLERNQLESDNVFDVLSKLPALRELNLAFNYFAGVKLRPETVECAFPLLEGLDLGFNYIGSESDVVVVVLFERLQRVILYGNPLAGPTGEDSLGLCVENLVEESDRIRGDCASYPIEFVTELPRIKQARGGGGGGRRRRPYGDIGITMVDEGYLPSAAAFRDAGNKSLFRFERRSTCGENDGEASGDTIVETTMRSAREGNDRAATAVSTSAAKAAAAGAQDLTFLTAVERQEEEQRGGGDAAEAGRLLGHGPGGAGGMSTRLLRGPVDPVVRGDPVKLRMALTALRYTLKHPVTSSMDVPWQQQQQQQQQQNGLSSRNNNRPKDKDSGGVGRKTAAARARQLPRRPYRLLKGPHQPSFCAGLLDGPTKESGSGGRGGLGRVDEVLTSMGAEMDAMVLEKQASQNSNSPQPRRPQLSSIIRTVNAVLDENEY